ncbi:MAG: hypothetical protein WA784_14765 [Albidovulum sp.]
MILRVIAILLTGLAALALWWGYGQLSVFRGTPFWDFRYIIYAAAAFLGLGAIEWALGWAKGKMDGDGADH